MALKIYTRTGDLGNTSLIGGTKVPKSHARIDTYGTVDELNAHIGLLRDYITDGHLLDALKEIQDRLFTIGSSLACDPEKEPALRLPDLKEADVVSLENEMDQMNNELPPMRFFVLPGGHVAISQAHIARCVCRRAERLCVHLQQHQEFVDPLVIKYLNRLSDYLFVVSRYLAKLLGVEEIAWKPRV
jgi:cob(I)alamin adenosyltransferase